MRGKTCKCMYLGQIVGILLLDSGHLSRGRYTAKLDLIYLPAAQKITCPAGAIRGVILPGGLYMRVLACQIWQPSSSCDILQYPIHPSAIHTNPAGHLHVSLPQKLALPLPSPPPQTAQLFGLGGKESRTNTSLQFLVKRFGEAKPVVPTLILQFACQLLPPMGEMPSALHFV